MHKNSHAMIDVAALEKKVARIPPDSLGDILRVLETIDKYHHGGSFQLPPRKANELREQLKDGIPIEFMDITVKDAYNIQAFLCTIPLLKGVMPEYEHYCNVQFDHYNQVFNDYRLPFHSEIKDFLVAYLKRKSEKWWDEDNRPKFDKKSGMIMLGSRFCQISLGAGNQMVICEGVFSVPLGEWMIEDSIIGKLVNGEENKRGVYDAVRAINKSAKKAFGIEDLLELEGLGRRVRIRKEVFE